jgi:hypothetical protein
MATDRKGGQHPGGVRLYAPHKYCIDSCDAHSLSGVGHERLSKHVRVGGGYRRKQPSQPLPEEGAGDIGLS